MAWPHNKNDWPKKFDLIATAIQFFIYLKFKSKYSLKVISKKSKPIRNLSKEEMNFYNLNKKRIKIFWFCSSSKKILKMIMVLSEIKLNSIF